MILEEFSRYLQQADPKRLASDVLSQWLFYKLYNNPASNVDKILHCEMAICVAKSSPKPFHGEHVQHVGNSRYTIRGKSDSGRMLLKSLYDYSCSYEAQKWSRWVHQLKASDFNGRPPS